MFYVGNDFESAKARPYKTRDGAIKAAERDGLKAFDEDGNQGYPVIVEAVNNVPAGALEPNADGSVNYAVIEKQAQMLIRQTPIMIFDDSLSAVDTETDAKIRASLEARFGSASILLISHRITTLSKADQILVLDHGRIAAEPVKKSFRARLTGWIRKNQANA